MTAARGARVAAALVGSALGFLMLSMATLARADASGLELRGQRGHAMCPLGGDGARTLLLDTSAQWRSVLGADEVEALGRPVHWRHERIVVVAMDTQPTLGIRVAAVALGPQPDGAPPRLGILITRPAPDSLAATALSRPCVVAAVARGGWRTLRVVDADAPGRALAELTVGAPLTVGKDPAPMRPSTELMQPAVPGAPAAPAASR
jgi:hypothetical protein